MKESDSFEWCPTWSSEQAVAGVQESRQVPEAGEVPEELPAFQAVNHERGEMGVDFRPHIYDPVMKKFILCDSGSQVGAFPPDPGDKPVPNLFLKAANGTKIVCYGYKDIEIKINRKKYPFKIIKAQVESPIVGWDFMKVHKLDLRWDDNDNITICDKKSKASTILHLKKIPVAHSNQMRNLSLIHTI